MKEKVTTITDQKDERIVGYNRVLRNALRLEKDIKRCMQKGVKEAHFGRGRGRGAYFEITENSLRFARLVAFSSFGESAFKPDKQIDKETGEAVRVIDPVGKEIAEKSIRDVRKERGIIRYE